MTLASHLTILSIFIIKPLKLALALITLEHVQNVAPPDQIINLLSSETTLLQQALQPRKLLLNISRVLLALLSNLAIVLSILVLSTSNSLLKLLLRLRTTTLQRAHNLVQRRDRASQSVETTARDAESASLFVQEGYEVGFAAARGVGDCFARAGGVVFDGRVGFDAGFLRGGFGVGGFAVDFGDEDVGLGGEVGGELFPDGGEGLAVCEGSVSCAGSITWESDFLRLTSTPRSSESNKHILVPTNLLLESRVGQHLHRAGRHLLRLRLHARLALHESRQALEVTATLVVLDLAIREPFQGREALDAVLAAELLVGIGIDFGNGDFVGGVLERTGELFVDGRESLAVAAPGGEELDERGFAGVEDDIVEVVREEVFDC
jgi:hypothetical protein